MQSLEHDAPSPSAELTPCSLEFFIFSYNGMRVLIGDFDAKVVLATMKLKACLARYERGEVFDEGKKCSNCPPGHMCNGGLCGTISFHTFSIILWDPRYRGNNVHEDGLVTQAQPLQTAPGCWDDETQTSVLHCRSKFNDINSLNSCLEWLFKIKSSCSSLNKCFVSSLEKP